MKIAVCDDEEKVRVSLAKKITGFFPEDTVEVYENGEEVLDARDLPDILLLDIKMPGMSGMDVAKKLRRKSEKLILIFVTGEEQYVYDSFDVQAFHFLVKPFSDEKLKGVLDRAKEQFVKQVEKKEKRYVMITNGGTHIRLCLDDVVYAEVFNSKVIVHKVNEDIEYYGKLTELERQAGEDFFRTHRAFLVHLKYVTKYNASIIYFDSGEALVSKQNYPAFVDALMQYNRRI